MAATPEGKVKKAVTKWLTDRGVYYFFIPANGFGRAGLPDLVAVHQGRFIGIEVKREGGKPTQLQLDELSKIRAAGGFSFVCDSVNVLVSEWSKIEQALTNTTTREVA